VKRVQTGLKGIPFLVTHDGRTIRYPDPLIKVNDTVQLDIATSKIMDSIKFDSGEEENTYCSVVLTLICSN
jgi:small subunit ribosomal protein S4e